MIFSQNTKENSTQADAFFKLCKNLIFGIGQPIIEIFYGIRKDTIPYLPVLAWGMIFDFLILSHLDRKIFKLLKLGWFYPQNVIAYSMYSFIGATFGFWIWGAIQARKKTNMIQRLTEVFQETGLKSPMGKLPNFIFDKPVDELVRRLRITNAFMPKSKFDEAKDRLESSLQVFIDEITESKAGGTIDLLYSHFEISKMFVRYPKYFPVFSSCNVGKKTSKRWCNNCPKCLFVYLTLYPHLEKRQLLKIFGRDLFDDKKLLPIMSGLIGKESPKPFECVGTRKESESAFRLSYKKVKASGKIPALLDAALLLY